MARRARTTGRERPAAVRLSISTAPRVHRIPVTIAEVEIDAPIGLDRARDAVVAIDDASRQLGLGVATWILVAARRLSADQARVRALIALDECQSPFPCGCLAPAAGLSIEKLTEAFVFVRPRLHEAQHAVQPIPVVVRWAEAPADLGEAAPADVDTAQRFLLDERLQFRGGTVDELRAKFDRCRESVLPVRADSTADPLSSFKDSDGQSGGAK